jgi:hypothetical protein
VVDGLGLYQSARRFAQCHAPGPIVEIVHEHRIDTVCYDSPRSMFGLFEFDLIEVMRSLDVILYSDAVNRSEFAVWSPPGEPLQRGLVIKRGSPNASVVVQWDSGRQERVKPREPGVRFAFDGTERLKWLLKPGLLEDRFRNNPADVFVDVIRDEGTIIQTATIKRRLVELGLDSEKVAKAFDRARPAIRANLHVVIKGASHSWSDVEVDPLADLRNLDPEEALDRLLNAPRLKADQKEALADAIRAGFRR